MAREPSTTNAAMSGAGAAPALSAAALDAIAARVRSAGVFGNIGTDRGRVVCAARASAEPAEYRLFVDDGRVWVALVTEHRWLSQSIEADLVHTGDKMEDLVEEELVEQGWESVRLPVEHFRDERKLYTFRSALPLGARVTETELIDKGARALLAYEAAFRGLGDMEAGDE